MLLSRQDAKLAKLVTNGRRYAIAVPDFVSSTFIPLIAARELGMFKAEGQESGEIVPIRALKRCGISARRSR